MPPEERLARFEHPAKAYALEYPAGWEHLVTDEGRSCGFGPPGRDDVGLWISILPIRADTEALRANLREIFEQAVGGAQVAHIREDLSLRHFALKGDSTAPEQGGHFWLVAGGDILLLASTQFPPGEHEAWVGPFDRLMASLHIARQDELFALRVTNALLERLRRQFPAHGYAYDGGAIRDGDHVISPGSVVRQVQLAPHRQSEIIEHFIAGLLFAGDDAPAADRLSTVRDLILPILKPAAYVRSDGPTASMLCRPWLGELIICYAIRGAKTLRFILERDRERWGTDGQALHDLARANLGRLPWPERLEGSGPAAAGPRGGRMVMVASGDGLDATRLLDPRLHGLLAPILGSPFLAGAPDRDTLVLFSTRDRKLIAHIAKKLREDYARAAYPISPHPFRVSADGIALAGSPPAD